MADAVAVNALHARFNDLHRRHLDPHCPDSAPDSLHPNSDAGVVRRRRLRQARAVHSWRLSKRTSVPAILVIRSYASHPNCVEWGGQCRTSSTPLTAQLRRWLGTDFPRVCGARSFSNFGTHRTHSEPTDCAMDPESCTMYKRVFHDRQFYILSTIRTAHGREKTRIRDGDSDEPTRSVP